MLHFNFEKNLSHQTQAVNSTIAVFEHLQHSRQQGAYKNCINPIVDRENGSQYSKNITEIQRKNGIDEIKNSQSNIVDIMMETGTGKTYTYTKTIFELNKHFGIFKFVIVVPTLSIKAGAVDFLKSDSARGHFRQQYGKTLKLHIVESKKGSKSKKSFMPTAVSSFVTSGDFEKNSIQVMIINAGMINSDTMIKSFDRSLFDTCTVAFDAIASVKPFLIIDEPHKFSKENKTWDNIKKMKAQFILRYGATFKEKENVVYTLSAVDAFNKNLVKGVIGHITEFEEGKNVLVKLVNTDGKEATFELSENSKKSTVKLIKKDSLQQLHAAMTDLCIENLNKTKVVLSNGLELKKGDTINPYSYAQTLQEIMIQKAVKHHFEKEQEYITREVRIKPLTLFFIDNIAEYRNEDGSIRQCLESAIKTETKRLLQTQTNTFYKRYLEKTLQDISKTHAGYFSRDNADKDEDIEQEVNEILHDKQAMLDLENPRRFIFSKWTLREGWDNPNVFQICKLRSSGSEISKLQEVGRGLRLPVNEYGNRVKDDEFYLNYFVDFTESDFVDSLVKEINEKSGFISVEKEPKKLTDDVINKICEVYGEEKNKLLTDLQDDSIIEHSNELTEGGWNYIKQKFPKIFKGVDSNKVRKSKTYKKQVSIRTEKYQELKDLWEKLNEKVILEYKFENESSFKALLSEFFKEQAKNFSTGGTKQRKLAIEIEDNLAVSKEEVSVLDDTITPISTMSYSDFIKRLSDALHINLKTMHYTLCNALVASNIDINKYLNTSTIRVIKQNFENYLMYEAFVRFNIEYKKVSNSIHPTKFTDSSGNVLSNIVASEVGGVYSDSKVADSYFLDTLFSDSELEKENIEMKETIKEVLVFTKIPKNSIKIPVAGGRSYSPDFAYVLHFENGAKKLHFIVETKGVEGKDNLRKEEERKIKHAEQFFNGSIKIHFKTQFKGDKIVELIQEITAK